MCKGNLPIKNKNEVTFGYANGTRTICVLKSNHFDMNEE